MHITSIVTKDYPVRVGDGHDPEIEDLSQLKHSRMRCQQEVDETMDNEAGKSLAWVLSSYYEDDRLIFFLMMMRSVRVGVARRSTPLNLYQRHVKKAVASPN